jgi:hypothetical protein
VLDIAYWCNTNVVITDKHYMLNREKIPVRQWYSVRDSGSGRTLNQSWKVLTNLFLSRAAFTAMINRYNQ